MKNKWDIRVYIDLYAGAGLSQVRGTATILKGSPFIALGVPHPFDKYIFCEEDNTLLSLLKQRVSREYPSVDVTYVAGNCDENVADIVEAIPRHSATKKVLCLCLVDPFDFGIRFETIRQLSARFTDFVVLLAIGMDANRNYDHYVDGNSPKLDHALGNTLWRTRWKEGRESRRQFRRFIATEFSSSMESLGFLPQPPDRMKQVRSGEKNLPLYHLALFSKHPTAYLFWDQVLKYSTDQQDLFG